MSAFQTLKRRIEDVITDNGPPPHKSLARALYVISIMYGVICGLRAFAYRQNLISSRRLPCKVICVGNISLGGTGKTPMTMHLARLFQELGHRPAVVSRGYRGEAERQGGIVSDGRSIMMRPDVAGDESYLMACKLAGIPVVIGKNRYAAGKLAIDRFQTDLIVLDDGYQHLKLERDIDLVLLDDARPFGNTHLLPRGILREPISSLERATACILTRCQDDGGMIGRDTGELLRKYAPRIPVFTSSHEPYCYVVAGGEPISFTGDSVEHFPPPLETIKNKPVYGFSGIARNAEFQNTVDNLGFKAKGFLEFSDHHRYTDADLRTIQASAREAGVRCLVTTEKDLVRLLPCNPFALELIVCGVEISFGAAQAKFISFLKHQLSH